MKKLYFITFCLLSATTIAQVNVTTITEEFSGSGGLSLDEVGNLYIGDFGDMLGGPDPDGLPNNILKLDTSLNLTQYATGFIGASGNGFDNAGVLYQSDIRDNAIYKIVNGIRTFVTSDGIFSPVGIVFDSDDNFYVCNCGNGTIQQVTPSGTSTVFASGPEFTCPNGITIDENNNLYVSNFSNNNIVKITPLGEKSIIGNTVLGNGHLDYDPNSRNLYIASYEGNQIFWLNIDSQAMDVLAGTGVRGNSDGPFNEATFSTPNGVAVSDDGLKIYINCAVLLSGAIINPQIIRLIDLNFAGIEDPISNSHQIKSYPNPVKETITIESELPLDYSNINIRIYTISGRLLKEIQDVMNGNSNRLKQLIDVSSLSSGNYVYTVSNGTKQLFSGKFFKE